MAKDNIKFFYPAEHIHENGWQGIINDLHILEGEPAYLTFDIDVLDPAFAPGTGTPEIGGLSTAQIMKFFTYPIFSKISWAGMDIVEVSPPYDHAEITSLAAATFIYAFLSKLSLKPIKE